MAFIAFFGALILGIGLFIMWRHPPDEDWHARFQRHNTAIILMIAGFSLMTLGVLGVVLFSM